MRKLGAEVTKVKGNYENSLNECIKQSKENGWEIVQDVAWEDYQKVPKLTMAGYSVMIEEISKQTDHYITHIFLQAGVGGMASGVIAGVARYFKRIPKIIIVEPKNADCVLKSIDAGKLTRVEIEKESIMGGMSCGGADCEEKKMDKKHKSKLKELLKKAGSNIKPDQFKRYGSARKLYNFNIDNVSNY